MRQFIEDEEEGRGVGGGGDGRSEIINEEPVLIIFTR